jgi:hypothetical protein
MRNKPYKRNIWKSAAPRRLLQLAGNPSSVEEAVQIVANRLLEAVPCPPTDLETIYPRVNVIGCHSAEISGSGELRRDVDGLKIVYSPNLSLSRRRFTIAHEIGHAVFETTGPRCPRSGDEVERLCDMIATELLMPRARFLETVDRDISLDKIMAVARLFQTSITATAIRFAELLNVSTFEVENAQISWGYGIKKRRATCSDIENAIRRAMCGQAGEDIVLLNSPIWRGEWRLEWTPIGNDKRALFLAKPLRRVR